MIDDMEEAELFSELLDLVIEFDGLVTDEQKFILKLSELLDEFPKLLV